ncbi:hypothetical protein IFR05_002408 [Cadophora sp. M221]|nr:hypothetical protein IFR05_002408 [Cadophora sp. M221]
MSSSKYTAAVAVSPSTSNAFQYEPLTEPESEIRLLRILPLIDPPKKTGASRFRKHNATATKAHRIIKDLVRGSRRNHEKGQVTEVVEFPEVDCEIFHVSLDQAPPYKALSYTWGSPNDPQLPIKLNQRTFSVRENLWLALQQLHTQPTPIIIWIDALCINQSDEIERNEQVTKMKTIYEKAEEVVVWLGPSYENSHLAFQFIQEMYDHRDHVEWIVQKFQLQQSELKQSVVGLGKLISREYWDRMWIVQELTVAKRISLRCGADSIGAVALDETQKLLRAMQSREMGFEEDPLFDLLSNDSLTLEWVRIRGLYDVRAFQQAFGSQDLSFAQCLFHNWVRQSSDPKDMVYGLAALANSTSKYQIKIDYSSSVAEVYIHLAKKEIQHCKTLEILTMARSGSTLIGLPSWVPDWSRNQDAHLFLYDVDTPHFAYSASRESTCDVAVADDGDVLFLKGVVIGKVEIIGESSEMKGMHDPENAARVFLKWRNLLGISGDRGNLIQEQFGRTLICDRFTDEESGDWGRDGFCRLMIGRFAAFCGGIAPPEDIDSELATAHSWMDQRYIEIHGNDFVEELRRNVSMAWIQHSADFICDRRFFLGSSNIMGLASQDIKEGDIICVPLGCPQPMIFRRVEDHYVVIGEAYVDGYMYGKAMEMLDRGELELETFELH